MDSANTDPILRKKKEKAIAKKEYIGKKETKTKMKTKIKTINMTKKTKKYFYKYRTFYFHLQILGDLFSSPIWVFCQQSLGKTLKIVKIGQEELPCEERKKTQRGINFSTLRFFSLGDTTPATLLACKEFAIQGGYDRMICTRSIPCQTDPMRHTIHPQRRKEHEIMISQQKGCHKSRHIPESSVAIALDQDEKAIRSAIRPQLQKKILLTQQQGYRVSYIDQRQEKSFYDAWHAVADYKHIGIITLDQFHNLMQQLRDTKTGYAIGVWDHQELIAGNVMIDTAQSTYYLYGFAQRGVVNKISPHGLLHRHCIKEAKDRAKNVYDFLGTYPSRADHTHPLWGIGRFKEQRGGIKTDYLGTWEFPLTRKGSLARMIGY